MSVMHPCCADLHQFKAAVAEDVLIIKNQPAKNQTWNVRKNKNKGEITSTHHILITKPGRS